MDLCAVDCVLSHLAAVAENDRGGYAAKHFVLNLVRVFAGMPGIINAHHLPTDTGVNGVGVGDTLRCQFDMEDEGNGENGDEDMIFGQEERNQFQEPVVFARVAAPYLCRALVALDARDGGSIVFPEGVLPGLAHLLGCLSGKLEDLDGPGSATWHPEVYGGIVSSAAVGAAVFEFFSARGRRTHGNGGDAPVGLLLSRELSRARKAWEDFEAARGGSEDVHPEVSSVISHALIRSTTT